jgi:hypothetical protein
MLIVAQITQKGENENMNTEMNTTEIANTTEVVIDRATERVMTVGAFSGLETAIRTMRSDIGGDTTVNARSDFGEDSVTEQSWLITNMNTGDQMRLDGVINVGASYSASQPTALPLNALQLLSASLLGMLRPAQRNAAIAAIEAGMDGAPSEEVAQGILDAVNLSDDALAAGQQVLSDMRRVSVRTRSAPVKFYPSDDAGLMPAADCHKV